MDSPRAVYVQGVIDRGIVHQWRTVDYSQDVHARAAMYRLTVPLLARACGLNLVGCLVVQGFAGCVLLYLVALLADRITGDRVVACFFCLSVSSIWAGHAGFVDLRPYYDGVALALLLAVLTVRSPTATFCLCLAALFTDERAAVGAGCILLFLVITRDRPDLSSPGKMAAILVALAAYAGARVGIQMHFHLPSQAPNLRSFVRHANSSALGAWTAFEGGWALIALSLVVLWRSRRYFACGLYVFLLTIGVISALSVDDITRSMAYLLPALFIALAIACTDLSRRELRGVVLACGVICVLWPAYYISFKSQAHWAYPLPLQVLRWMVGGESTFATPG